MVHISLGLFLRSCELHTKASLENVATYKLLTSLASCWPPVLRRCRCGSGGYLTPTGPQSRISAAVALSRLSVIYFQWEWTRNPVEVFRDKVEPKYGGLAKYKQGPQFRNNNLLMFKIRGWQTQVLKFKFQQSEIFNLMNGKQIWPTFIQIAITTRRDSKHLTWIWRIVQTWPKGRPLSVPFLFCGSARQKWFLFRDENWWTMSTTATKKRKPFEPHRAVRSLTGGERERCKCLNWESSQK